MGEIGVLEEYIVRIEDSSSALSVRSAFDPGSNYALHEVPWSSLKWSRVLSDVSMASVVVPDDQWGRTLCPYPLHGWDQTLAFYRNGELVWRGPILGWRRNDDGLVEISAGDVISLCRKWFIYIDHDFSEVDLWALVSAFFTDQATYEDWFNLVDPAQCHPGGVAGWGVTREYKTAQMKTLYASMRELVEQSGLFFSAGPDRVHYDPDEYNFGSASPALHEGSCFSIPKIAVDCSEVADRMWAVGDDAGVGGFQTITDVSMTTQFNVPAYSEVFVLQAVAEPDLRLQGAPLAQAATPAAVEALSPKVTIETVELTTSFGGLGSGAAAKGSFSGIDDLRPGLRVRWGFDADCMSEVPINTLLDPVAAFDAVTFIPFRRYDVWPPYEPGGPVENPTVAAEVFISADRIDWMTLVQLDVTASASDEGMVETINANFIPMAVSDG